jgi:hypothetical protein
MKWLGVEANCIVSAGDANQGHRATDGCDTECRRQNLSFVYFTEQLNAPVRSVSSCVLSFTFHSSRS